MTNDLIRYAAAAGGNALTSFMRLYVCLLLLWSAGIASLSFNTYNLEHIRMPELIVDAILVAGIVAFVSALPMLIVCAILFVVLGGLKK
jgi:hypothetical protein